MTWAFGDLFIINISLGLTQGFRQINKELSATRGLKMSPGFYWKCRKIYSKMRTLVNDFDEAINTITMMTLTKNVFVICADLFNIFL